MGAMARQSGLGRDLGGVASAVILYSWNHPKLHELLGIRASCHRYVLVFRLGTAVIREPHHVRNCGTRLAQWLRFLISDNCKDAERFAGSVLDFCELGLRCRPDNDDHSVSKRIEF